MSPRLISLEKPFWFAQNPNFLLFRGKSVVSHPQRRNAIAATSLRLSSLSHPQRYAVLGAGFAGLSVAWHLLEHSPKEMPLCIDLYDEIGIGGGASGVSGGLLHPYSPKGGILRPATSAKNDGILRENARDCPGSCRVEFIDKDAALNLVPGLTLPLNSAVYMPEAVNIHPKRYLQALFLACQNQVEHLSASGYSGKEICLRRKAVHNLAELSGEGYNAVIICLGAKVDMLPELAGKLPIRKCRGIVAQLQLPNKWGEYGQHSPSILSDAWLAVQGPQRLVMGATWEWGSSNYSSSVLEEEANWALKDLVARASTVYPSIRNWSFTGIRAGVRAMPPLTPLGSLPLLGCVDDYVSGCENVSCKYWLMGGLGSRGLLYHGWLGKLMALAVLSCDEAVLPSELTSWKNIKAMRKL